MIKKLLIANRGEIALRILRACRELDISTVAIYSEADKEQMHVKMADESICIGPADVNKSYLNIPSIVSAMELSGADGVHPGYGFLAESSDFAEKIENSGFQFAGPSSEIIGSMGNKLSAKEIVKGFGIPTLPGSDGPVTSNAHKIAKEIGFPLMIKAASGGGGKGMRVVESLSELDQSLEITSSEAMHNFGDPSVYLEKYLNSPRHIEVQILGDSHGNIIHLGDRDCSIQRRNQKILEEAPALGIESSIKEKIFRSCMEMCREIGYESAGTFEFLFQDNEFFFIEMNTRLQVEHPVTESITGLDLVKLQLRVARGEELKVKQKDVIFSGHAIECRINAEHPKTFLPSPGKVTDYHQPGGIGVRVDSHLYNNYKVPPFYDSLIAKIICSANDREDARVRLARALDEMFISGIDTNLELHRDLVMDKNFIEGGMDINYLEKNYRIKL